MSDRRRSPRYLLCASPAGRARLHQHIQIEKVEDGRAIARADTPVSASEVLLLQTVVDGIVAEYRVRAIVCAAEMHHGGVHYRLVLLLQDVHPMAQATQSRRATLRPVPGPAVLIRSYEVLMRDVSVRGALLETTAPITVGTVGRLEVELGERRCSDVFRVCRMQRLEASQRPYRVGVEFLPLTPAGEESLRGVMGRVERGDLIASGTKSGAEGTLDLPTADDRIRHRGEMLELP